MDYRNELLKELGLSTFVVVDLETTGLSPDDDTIIEIGAVKYVDGKESEVFETLVNPQRPISNFITRLTGISDEDVAEAPVLDAVFPKLDAFIKDIPFVGHQVNFDASFIEHAYRVKHNDFDRWEDKLHRFKYFNSLRVDTLFLSRILVPFLPKMKLGVVAEYFGHSIENAHRATDDARATGHVFLELVDRALALDNKALSDIVNLLFANSKRAKTFFLPILKFKQHHNLATGGAKLIDDVKNAQTHYNVLGKREQIFAEEEAPLEPINPDAVEQLFKEEGTLSTIIENYESREEQKIMAQEVTDSLNKAQFLVAEAGTGTGKSMAYLAPAIEWAVTNRKANERVVISTNTKNLQEQLFYKDLPTLFSAKEGNFKAVLLKGRGNYLCLDKWNTIMTDMNQRLSQDERSRILPLVLWAKETRTGDISENAAFQVESNRGLWQKFIAEPSYCPGKTCSSFSDCYLMKARDHARKSDLVVVNHALLFSDLAADHSILGPYDNLVIDEAHNVEKTAAEHLGARISFWTFRNIYHRLYELEPKKTGTILQLEFRLNKKHFLKEEDVKQIFRYVAKIKKLSTGFKQDVLQFYNDFHAYMQQQIQKSSKQNDGYKVRYRSNFKYFRDNEEAVEKVSKASFSLIKQLAGLNNLFLELDPDQFDFQDQISRELITLEQDLKMAMETFEFCIKAEEKKYVYWLEVPTNLRNVDVLLYAVPLHIAQLLQDKMFSNLRSAVLTSATISINKNFNYFQHRIGLDMLPEKEVHAAIFGSPFNYEEQIKLAVTDFMPDPRNQEYVGRLIELIKELHGAEKRGMMVLFTSYSLLNMVYNAIQPWFDEKRILVLAQGKSGSRSNIIAQFKENKDSILLGTDSFWEGVDVQGDALQVLLIPKLPFDVPTEPLIAARMDEIKEQGGNAFFDYSVPEAIIKFKQGFGRLIRHKSDYGTVICCDNRLSKMQYGKQFLNSLPVNAEIYRSQEEMITEIGTWFKEKET